MVLKSFVPLLQQEEEEFGPKKGIHTGTHNGNKNTERKRETKMEGRHTEGNCIRSGLLSITLFTEHAGGTRKRLTVFNQGNTGNNHNRSLSKHT